jgi:hypothetical protein
VIPPFDPATGNLPAGTHEASWPEIMARFGTTEHRRTLLAGFRAALEILEAAGCRLIYLDGNFVTAKEIPGDFDACWEPTGVDLPQLGLLAPEFFDLRAGRKQLKLRYGGELIPIDPIIDDDGEQGTSILRIFQRDKYTKAPKGIIAIRLGDDHDHE